jgi:hypothetical protein
MDCSHHPSLPPIYTQQIQRPRLELTGQYWAFVWKKERQGKTRKTEGNKIKGRKVQYWSAVLCVRCITVFLDCIQTKDGTMHTILKTWSSCINYKTPDC